MAEMKNKGAGPPGLPRGEWSLEATKLGPGAMERTGTSCINAEWDPAVPRRLKKVARQAKFLRRPPTSVGEGPPARRQSAKAHQPDVSRRRPTTPWWAGTSRR